MTADLQKFFLRLSTEDSEGYGTDPHNSDTDGGGVMAGDEVAVGTDSTDDDPTLIQDGLGEFDGSKDPSCGCAAADEHPMPAGILALLAGAVGWIRRRED